MPNQSKREITFDTQLETALLFHVTFSINRHNFAGGIHDLTNLSLNSSTNNTIYAVYSSKGI